MPLRTYSKGMMQRVGVAQALVGEPEVVFLDEPMSGLDPLGRRHMRQLMLRLRDRGCTVFFSSHILSDAEAMCSRVAILANGRLMAQGKLADIVAFNAAAGNLSSPICPRRPRPRSRDGSPRSRRCRINRYTLEVPPVNLPSVDARSVAARSGGRVVEPAFGRRSRIIS